jgi:hypothetical protein
MVEAMAWLWQTKVLPWVAVSTALGDQSPGDTTLKTVLGPLYKRLQSIP